MPPIVAATLPAASNSSLIYEKALIDGAWISDARERTFDVTSPINGEIVVSVPDMGAAETLRAIDAAHKVCLRESKKRNIKVF